MSRLRRYAIIDADGTVWLDTASLGVASREVRRLRAEEAEVFDFLLVDRQLGPLTDDGLLKRCPRA